MYWNYHFRSKRISCKEHNPSKLFPSICIPCSVIWLELLDYLEIFFSQRNRKYVEYKRIFCKFSNLLILLLSFCNTSSVTPSVLCNLFFLISHCWITVAILAIRFSREKSSLDSYIIRAILLHWFVSNYTNKFSPSNSFIIIY